MKKYIYEEVVEELKKEMTYKPGDIVNVRWQGAGFITTAGSSLRFTLPLDKPTSANSATLNGNLTLRQDSKYIYGNAAEDTPITNLTEKFNGFSVSGATFNYEKSEGFTNAVNNHAVGILFTGTITFK